MEKKEITYREFVAKFLQFLKENEAHKKFKRNVIHSNRYNMKGWYNYINPLTIRIYEILKNDAYLEEVINIPFTWSDTLEGYTYWSDLNRKWKDKIKGYKLKKENGTK